MKSEIEGDQPKQEAEALPTSQARPRVGENQHSDDKANRTINLRRFWRCIRAAYRKVVEPLSVMDSVGYFTAVLAVIAGLQWRTLEKQWETFEKSDRTLKDTLAASKLQQRATIYMQPVGVEKFLDSWIFTTWMGNSGLTPTTTMKYALDCVTSADQLFDEARLKNKAVENSIGPQVKDSGLEGCVKSNAAIDEIISKKGGILYLIGRAAYTDATQEPPKNKHLTEFCVAVSTIKKIPARFRDPPTLKLRAGHCSEGHNCTDEQCKKYYPNGLPWQ